MTDKQYCAALAGPALQNDHQALEPGCIQGVIDFIANPQLDGMRSAGRDKILQRKRACKPDLSLLAARVRALTPGIHA